RHLRGEDEVEDQQAEREPQQPAREPEPPAAAAQSSATAAVLTVATALYPPRLGAVRVGLAWCWGGAAGAREVRHPGPSVACAASDIRPDALQPPSSLVSGGR